MQNYTKTMNILLLLPINYVFFRMIPLVLAPHILAGCPRLNPVAADALGTVAVGDVLRMGNEKTLKVQHQNANLSVRMLIIGKVDTQELQRRFSGP